MKQCTICKQWEFSSVGRASALHAECHRFEPGSSYQTPLWLNLILLSQVGGLSAGDNCDTLDSILFNAESWEIE